MTQLETAHGLVLIYSVTDLISFQRIEESLEHSLEMAPHLRNTDRIILIGNKIDLEADRVVTTEMGQSKATANNWTFFETSALTLVNVDTSFTYLITKCKDYLDSLAPPAPQRRERRCDIQ